MTASNAGGKNDKSLKNNAFKYTVYTEGKETL